MFLCAQLDLSVETKLNEKIDTRTKKLSLFSERTCFECMIYYHRANMIEADTGNGMEGALPVIHNTQTTLHLCMVEATDRRGLFLVGYDQYNNRRKPETPEFSKRTCFEALYCGRSRYRACFHRPHSKTSTLVQAARVQNETTVIKL